MLLKNLVLCIRHYLRITEYTTSWIKFYDRQFVLKWISFWLISWISLKAVTLFKCSDFMHWYSLQQSEMSLETHQKMKYISIYHLVYTVFISVMRSWPFLNQLYLKNGFLVSLPLAGINPAPCFHAGVIVSRMWAVLHAKKMFLSRQNCSAVTCTGARQCHKPRVPEGSRWEQSLRYCTF